MNELAKYVYDHTERGECKCGKCLDAGRAPDPTGHTIDMVFFKVAAINKPDIDEFKRLTAEEKYGEFAVVDPFDGKEHNYMELGAWIGDQGLALLYMALGVSLGAFNLYRPALLVLGGDLAMKMAGMGLLSIQAKAVREEVPA